MTGFRHLHLALVVLGLALAAVGTAGLTGTWFRPARQDPPADKAHIVPVIVSFDPIVVKYLDFARGDPTAPSASIPYLDEADYERDAAQDQQQVEIPTYDAVTGRGVLWGAVIWVGVAIAVFSARRRRPSAMP